MAFTIEKGVPLSDARKTTRLKYPFPDMEIGDSFCVPGDRRNTLSVAASLYGKRNGLKFTVSCQGDGRVRCWRVS